MSRRTLRTAVALALVTVLSLTAPPAALAASSDDSAPGLAQLIEWVQDLWNHLIASPPPSPPQLPQERGGASPAGREGNGPILHVSGRGGTIDPNGVNFTEHSDP
ncbi:MAG TPA: hypothetical protein VHN15_13085 [Thermoanaerobaculia bacterium]|nr:hypothetical protein [Thermoanaerobaculia bacterium]